MKIKELIEQLQGLDPELEVYVAADAEGNSFNRCGGAWEYYTESDEGDYSIEHVFSDEQEIDDFFDGEFEPAECRKVAIIWP